MSRLDNFYAWVYSSDDLYGIANPYSFANSFEALSTRRSNYRRFSVALQCVQLSLSGLTNLDEALFDQPESVHVYVLPESADIVRIRLDRKLYSPSGLAADLNEKLADGGADRLVQFLVTKRGTVYVVGFGKFRLLVHRSLCEHIPIKYEESFVTLYGQDYRQRQLESDRRRAYGPRAGVTGRTLSKYHRVSVNLQEKRSSLAAATSRVNEKILATFPFRLPSAEGDSLFLRVKRKAYFPLVHPVSTLSISIRDADGNVLGNCNSAAAAAAAAAKIPRTSCLLQFKTVMDVYERNHVVRFSSEDSKAEFPQNGPANFVHQFASYRELVGRGWKAALLSVSIPSSIGAGVVKQHTIGIFTDIITEYTVGNRQKALLKVIGLDRAPAAAEEASSRDQHLLQFDSDHLDYFSVSKNKFHTVSFELRNLGDGKDEPLVQFDRQYEVTYIDLLFVKL